MRPFFLKIKPVRKIKLKQLITRHTIRTLTLITPGTMALDPDELAKREPIKEFPRVSLFRQKLNSDLLDERFIQNLPLKKKIKYRILPMSAVQVLEAYSIRDQYDAIISWAERLGLPLALLMKMMGKRVPHIGLFSWISKPKKALTLKMVQSHFDKIVLMSSAQWDFAVNNIGIPREKVVLLKWPVDQEFWAPVQLESDMFCAVGREMRDYRTFLTAMEGLSIRCHIAAGGITGNKKDEWKKDLDNLTLPPDNITIGKVPFYNLRELYARSRFVVVPLLPTETDNGSTTILEAMSMGRAVICTKTAGQRDIIQDGKNGIFVPQGDVRALRNAIEYLWNNPNIAENMGREGRKFIERQHSLDVFVENIRLIVEEVVDEFRSCSYKRPHQYSGLRTLTIVAKGVPRKRRSVMRQMQDSDSSPRILLYEDRMHSVILSKKAFEDTPPWRKIPYKILPFPVAKTIEAFIVRKHFDAVICWSAPTAISFAAILKISRVRYPAIVLLSWISSWKKSHLLKFVSSHIDKIVLWSSTQKDFALNKLNIPEEKISFVNRRVDHTFWRPMQMETNMICSAGQEMRDYPTLIEAIKGLDIRCHIATGILTGTMYKTVKAIYDYGELPPNITVGRLSLTDLRKTYAQSRFVVVPLLQTDTDNGATTIEEAMAMGKAIICSRTKGQVDLIQEGKTGIFVPPGDPGALRTAIQYLWNNPEVAKEMGRAGREYIEAHHTFDLFVKNVKDVVEGVIQQYQGTTKGDLK